MKKMKSPFMIYTESKTQMSLIRTNINNMLLAVM